MSYTSWSVVFGEQPSAAKWNILGTNDASFNTLFSNAQFTGINYQSLTTNSVKADAYLQAGWSFINNDGSEASTTAITFPVAYGTSILGVLVSLNGERAGSDPTLITQGVTVAPTDTVQETIAASNLLVTGFTVVIKRTAASSGARALFSWLALGI